MMQGPRPRPTGTVERCARAEAARNCGTRPMSAKRRGRRKQARKPRVEKPPARGERPFAGADGLRRRSPHSRLAAVGALSRADGLSLPRLHLQRHNAVWERYAGRWLHGTRDLRKRPGRAGPHPGVGSAIPGRHPFRRGAQRGGFLLPAFSSAAHPPGTLPGSRMEARRARRGGGFLHVPLGARARGFPGRGAGRGNRLHARPRLRRARVCGSRRQNVRDRADPFAILGHGAPLSGPRPQVVHLAGPGDRPRDPDAALPDGVFSVRRNRAVRHFPQHSGPARDGPGTRVHGG